MFPSNSTCMYNSIYMTESLSPSSCRLLNSNTFTTIADDAFAGLSNLQYLWVSNFMPLSGKNITTAKMILTEFSLVDNALWCWFFFLKTWKQMYLYDLFELFLSKIITFEIEFYLIVINRFT